MNIAGKKKGYCDDKNNQSSILIGNSYHFECIWTGIKSNYILYVPKDVVKI